MSVSQAYWVVLLFCLQMVAIKAFGIFSSHLKVRLQISGSVWDFKHLPFRKEFPDSRLFSQAPVTLTGCTKVKESLRRWYDIQVWKGWMVCLNAGRQGNMAHPLQQVLLLLTLLPTLVLGWGEGSPCSVHSGPWTQAPAFVLNSLEIASLPQQLMSLHHSPNSLATFS